MDEYLKIQSRRIKKRRYYGKEAGKSNHQGETDVSKRRKETDKKFFLQGDNPKERAKRRKNFGRLFRYAGAKTQRAGRRHFFREPDRRGKHIQGKYGIYRRTDLERDKGGFV